ncbi:MAG TPA: iron ABC transporter permease [Hyphomicrobiales bacterium]|nr:iron ABC transporter permease [Hyphomicrobiales bacterium]
MAVTNETAAPAVPRRQWRARRRSEIGIAGLVVLAIAIAAALYLISAPLGMLLAAALRGPPDVLPFEAGARWTLGNLAAAFGERELYTRIIPNTVVFTVASVALTFVIAFVLAWLVERTDLPLRNVTFTLVLFPLLIPGVVVAIAWIILLSPKTGLLNVLLRDLLGLQGQGPLNIFSMGGMVFAQAVVLVPFVFLLLTVALRSMNPALEEASQTAGASPLKTFLRVTLPVLRPGLIAPLILATLVTLEQFEIPLMLGLTARVNVFSTQIYYEITSDTDLPAYGRAAATALPFLAAGLLLLLAYNRAVRRAESFVTITGKGYRPAPLPLGKWKAPAVALVVAYAVVAVLLPAVVLVWASFFGYRRFGLATLSAADVTGYVQLFTDPGFWRAVGNTFLVAGLSAGIATIVGALVSWATLRTRLPGRGVVDFVTFMSVGIPSVIAGLACLMLYLSLPIGVYGTVWVLVLAYSYRLAVSTRLSRSALMQIHPELEEASSAAGGQWGTTIRRVVLPLLAPSLMASFVLLFIVGFREFTLPMLLQSPKNVVLSVIMYQDFNNGQVTEAAAVAVIIVACVTPVIFVMRRQLLKGDGKG